MFQLRTLESDECPVTCDEIGGGVGSDVSIAVPIYLMVGCDESRVWMQKNEKGFDRPDFWSVGCVAIIDRINTMEGGHQG
jgi:hypothetical protein